MAIHHDVVIDGEMYCLFEDAGGERLKKDVLDAARAGGGFVTVRRSAASCVEVMVTATTAIRIEHTSSADVHAGGPRAGEPVGFRPDDVDWWF